MDLSVGYRDFRAVVAVRLILSPALASIKGGAAWWLLWGLGQEEGPLPAALLALTGVSGRHGRVLRGVWRWLAFLLRLFCECIRLTAVHLGAEVWQIVVHVVGVVRAFVAEGQARVDDRAWEEQMAVPPGRFFVCREVRGAGVVEWDEYLSLGDLGG